jgi:hypothetical protein
VSQVSSSSVVLGSLGAVALLAGVQGYLMLRKSQAHMKVALMNAQVMGSTLDVLGCLDHTLSWYAKCDAMKSLCDGSVGRIMTRCLESQPRTQQCLQLGQATQDTHFGFAECKARGVNRWNKKACAESFRSLDRFCAATVHREAN